MPDWDKVRYCIYQRELCPTTQKPHFQGYLELTSPQRLAALKKHWCETAHYESRKGTRDQARDYCRKADTRDPEFQTVEFGEWEYPKGQGSRTDLQAWTDLISKFPLAEACQVMPVMMLRFPNGSRTLKNLMILPRTKLTTMIVYWGVPGSGKSYAAASISSASCFWKSPDNRWWDGYEGQKTVILDDFSPDQLPLAVMLRLVDRYPLQLEVKGGMVQFVAETIVVTANTDPKTWYGGCAQWRRRITEEKEFKEPFDRQYLEPGDS